MPSSSALPPVAPSLSPEQAYELCKAEIAAVDPDATAPVNLDVRSVVITLLGALPEILALRSKAEKLPDYDVSAFDKLERYALAALWTGVRCQNTTLPPEALAALNEEASGRRALLMADAKTLVLRHLMASDLVAQYKGAVGYKNVASELFGLVELYKTHWKSIEAVTTVTAEEVDEANRLAMQIYAAIGFREQTSSATVEATRTRAQAFTLLLETYDTIRQAVSFLRWKQGDAETIAPSLWAGRGRRPRAENAPEQPPAPTPPEPTPAKPLVPGGPGGSPFVG